MTLQENEKTLREKIFREETGQNLIRIERSATLAINSNFEKATFDLQLTIPQNSLISKEELNNFICTIENIVEEHVNNFKKVTLGKNKSLPPNVAPQTETTPPRTAKPSTEPSIPLDGWRQWSSGNGESLHGDFSNELFNYLMNNSHDEKSPYKHSDGYTYWIYPDSDYIQRARRP